MAEAIWTIWKFPVEFTDEQMIPMPAGANILSVGQRDGKMVLWAMVQPRAHVRKRKIVVYGTGNPLPDAPGLFIGTVQVGEFVWHVFEN